MVCEPKTINPDHPGNPDYMKSHARDSVNKLINPLKKLGFYCPPECTTEDKSLKEWFSFLGKARIEL